VKEDCRPDIVDVAFKGMDAASATPQVIAAILSADVVLICPSNPIASIGPILSVAGVRDSLKNSKAVKIAVSPLVGGKSLKGPSDRMMRAKGFSPDALGVAACYNDLIDGVCPLEEIQGFRDDLAAHSRFCGPARQVACHNEQGCRDHTSGAIVHLHFFFLSFFFFLRSFTASFYSFSHNYHVFPWY
jgi:hypothetical protein